MMKKLAIQVVVAAMATVTTASDEPGLRLTEAWTSGTGFKLTIHTPKTWIAMHEQEAASKFLPFGEAEISEEMRRSVLRVIVHPNAQSSNLAVSAQHVVIRSTDKKASVALQPSSIEPFTETFGNAMGATLEVTGVTATFDLDAVRKITASDPKGEFLVTVVGTRQADFKVKDKHLKELPGLQ
jgi:hypothetical protein